MENDLEYGLVYSTDIEHDSLYGWCIQEIDKEGNQVGNDQIPWGWDLNFKTKTLCIVTNIGVKNNKSPSVRVDEDNPHDWEMDEIKVKIEETIQGILVPFSFRYPYTDYSLFGTDRKIKEFSFLLNFLRQN